MKRFLFYFLIGTVVLLQLGCDKETEIVPAYLYIDSFTFSTEFNKEGLASSDIVDAWILINNDFYGAFTLPALVPIDVLGDVEITVLPGIRINGINQNRKPYSMYQGYKEVVNFQETKTDTISPSTKYKDNVKFVWREDFEDQAHSTLKSSNDNCRDSLIIIDSFNSNAFKPGLNSAYTGCLKMEATDTFKIFEHVTLNKWVVPNGANDVFLEMDLKSNTAMQVGIYVEKVDIYEQIGVVLLFDTEQEWKKFYLNLNPETGGLQSTDKIQIFFGVINNGSNPSFEPELYWDNLKLVHLN